MKNKPLNLIVYSLVTVLFCYSVVCFGQTAKINPSNCVIEFEIDNVKSNQIITVELKNPAGGISQIYTRNNDIPQLRLPPAASNGIFSEIMEFRIHGTATQGMPCNMTVNGNVYNLPADLEKTPLKLIVDYYPDPNDTTKTDSMLITVKQVAKTLKKLEIPRVAAESRDDAELYVSGESITAIGEGPKFSADIQIKREFGKKGVPFLFTPFFELKWSNTQEDSDKLGFGIRFSNSFKFSKSDDGVLEDRELNRRLKDAAEIGEEQTPKYMKINKRRTQAQYFLWEGTGEIESSFNFRVTNLITSQELKYKIRPKLFRRDGEPLGKINLTPFIGTELGWNLKSPVLRDESGIVRLKAGATLNLNINKPFGESFIQAITWENSFTQRWFVIKEQAYDKDDDGNLILRDLGRRPRGYFSSDLQFKLSDYLGFGMKYEWGQLPPLYEKVNHRLKVGFTYSFRRKAF